MSTGTALQFFILQMCKYFRKNCSKKVLAIYICYLLYDLELYTAKVSR